MKMSHAHKLDRAITDTCSCLTCDSATCFLKRNRITNIKCSCNKCQLPTCINNAVKENKRNELEKECNEINDFFKKFVKRITNPDNEIFSKNAPKNKASAIKDACKTKCTSHIKETIEIRNVTRIHGVAINCSHKKNDNVTAKSKLTAQVMNIPLGNLGECKGFIASKTSLEGSRIRRKDIYSRLEEIYNACSCRICECISGTSLPTHQEYGKYLSCGCKDYNLRTKKIPHDGCPCIRCDKKDCKGVVKNLAFSSSCNCDTSKRIKFSESFGRACNCISCQCINCNFLKKSTLKQAIIDNNMQQNVCNCNPCECNNCVTHYGPLSTTSARNASTEMIRHCPCNTCADENCQSEIGNCECDNTNRVMRKLIEKNYHDYDIHRAVISKDSPFCWTMSKYNTGKQKKDEKPPLFHNISSNANRCVCADCECIMCKDKIRPTKSHSGKFSKNGYDHLLLTDESENVCKCLPCECQICNKVKSENNIFVKSLKATCDCNTCDCISCHNLYHTRQLRPNVGHCLYLYQNETENTHKYVPFKVTESKNSININKIKCKEVKNEHVDIIYELLCPSRIGKILSPSSFELSSNRKSLNSSVHKHESETESISKRSASKPTSQKSVCFKKSTHIKPDKKIIIKANKLNDKGNQRGKENLIKNNILANYMIQENVMNGQYLDCICQGNIFNINDKQSLDILYDNCLSQSNYTMFNTSFKVEKSNYTALEHIKNTEDNINMISVLERLKEITKEVDDYTIYLLNVLKATKKTNEYVVKTTQQIKYLQNSALVDGTNFPDVISKIICLLRNTEHYLSDDILKYSNDEFHKIEEIDKSHKSKIVRSLNNNVNSSIQVHTLSDKNGAINEKDTSDIFDRIQTSYLNLSNFNKETIKYTQGNVKLSASKTDNLDPYKWFSIIPESNRAVKTSGDKTVKSCFDEEDILKLPQNLRSKHNEVCLPVGEYIFSTISPLQEKLVYKQVTQNGSTQTMKRKVKVDKEVRCSNITLVDQFGTEIENILEVLISNAIHKSELASKISKASYIQEYDVRNKEEYRAKFKEIRRISNNTVFVRWNLPKEIEKVIGYEDENGSEQIDPTSTRNTQHVHELKKALYCGVLKENKGSQYVDPAESIFSYIQTIEDTKWQNVESVDDLDHILRNYGQDRADTEKPSLERIRITDIPRIKVVAEKFSKMKKNNLEVRKLEERIVCVEYDVFDGRSIVEPSQKMRAYFSLKPVETYQDSLITILPPAIKETFLRDNEDLDKLNEKEIEIMDDKLEENKPYIEDLRKVLKKRGMIRTKNKNTLDLKYLYEIAERNARVSRENITEENILSEGELDEIKKMILNECSSSIHGINRRTFKKDTNEIDKNGRVSESIFTALIRN